MYYWHWFQNLIHGPKTTGFPTAPATFHVPFHPDAIVPGTIPPEAFPNRATALRQVDGGSCNGCESELSLLSSPDYDFSRYGFSFAPSPRHADILVVTGVITTAMAPIIQDVLEAMPHPKRVIALGNCAIDGGVFQKAPGVIGHLSTIVAVSLSIKGCPPTPADILRGLLWAADGHDPWKPSNEQERA